jgi:hypothetical protein
VEIYWVAGHAGVPGNEIADELARGSSVLEFLGSEPPMGISRRNMRKKGLVVGWPTSIGYDGEALAILKERLEN